MASGNALKIRRNEIKTRKKKSKFTRKNSLEPVVSDHLQSTCFPPVTKEKKKKRTKPTHASVRIEWQLVTNCLNFISGKIEPLCKSNEFKSKKKKKK